MQALEAHNWIHVLALYVLVLRQAVYIEYMSIVTQLGTASYEQTIFYTHTTTVQCIYHTYYVFFQLQQVMHMPHLPALKISVLKQHDHQQCYLQTTITFTQ